MTFKIIKLDEITKKMSYYRKDPMTKFKGLETKAGTKKED